MKPIYIPVSVEQELPKKVNENYLTISETGIETSRFFNDNQRFETAHYEGKITYWLKPIASISNLPDEWKTANSDVRREKILFAIEQLKEMQMDSMERFGFRNNTINNKIQELEKQLL